MSIFLNPPAPRRRALLQFFVLTGLGVAGCGGRPDDPQADAADVQLQRLADASVASGLIGLALGEVTRDTAAVGVAGKRRQGADAAVRRADRFAMGSNTKAMTSAALVAMAERAWLSLDLTPAQAFPSWAREIHAAYAHVTLRDLLHHRGAIAAFNGSGPEEQAFLAAVAADAATLPQTQTDRRRVFARWLLRQAPVAGVTPGRDFHYSNAGYVLAATMAEAHIGRAFEDVFDEALVQPLQLQGQWRSEVPDPQEALRGHEGPLGSVVEVTATDELLAVKPWLDVLGPAGLWACSVDEYAQWLRWHVVALQGGPTPLARTYVAELAAAADNRYVWGWQSIGTASRVVLAHTGHLRGFMAETVMDTRGERALFGLSNTGHMAEDETSWVLGLIDTALSEILRLRAPAS